MRIGPNDSFDVGTPSAADSSRTAAPHVTIASATAPESNDVSPDVMEAVTSNAITSFASNILNFQQSIVKPEID